MDNVITYSEIHQKYWLERALALALRRRGRQSAALSYSRSYFTSLLYSSVLGSLICISQFLCRLITLGCLGGLVPDGEIYRRYYFFFLGGGGVGVGGESPLRFCGHTLPAVVII